MGAHSAILRIKQRSLAEQLGVVEREVAHYGCAVIDTAHYSALAVKAEQVDVVQSKVAHYDCALVALYGCALINIAHYTALSRSRRSRWVWWEEAELRPSSLLLVTTTISICYISIIQPEGLLQKWVQFFKLASSLHIL